MNYKNKMGYWKGKVVQFLKLKSKGVVFQPARYDFIYVYHKRSIGIITEFHRNNIYSISFFKSLNNPEPFIDLIKFDTKNDVVIPSYESLLKIGHIYIKKISDKYKTDEFEVSNKELREKDLNKFKLYGRLNILFKQTGDEKDDYDNLLNLILSLIKENQSRLQGRD